MPNRYKSVKDSITVLTELMIPSYANFGGKVHGGLILSLLDKVAYTCASKHCSGYCVTVSVDEVDFHNPVEVGDLVSMYASVNYVGKSSMVIGVKVVSENFKKGTVIHTNTSFFTMVAMDEETKKPVQVPGLILESSDDIRRFIDASKRKDLKQEYKKALKRHHEEAVNENHLELLSGENCKIPDSSDLYGTH
jgi:acyl-CoA hydrolase